MKPTKLFAASAEKPEKKVSFSPSTKKSKDVEFTPYQKTKKLHYTDMKRDVLSLLQKAEYNQVISYFTSFIPQEINAFFKKEGKILLRWAIINSSDCQILDFLINKIPPEISIQCLTENNFSILDSFLGGQSTMEKSNLWNEFERKLAVEKLKILFKLDSQEINEFIENNTTPSLKNLLINSHKTTNNN